MSQILMNDNFQAYVAAARRIGVDRKIIWELAPGTDGPIIPGDPEREAEAERRTSGVPVVAAVIEDLRAVSLMTGVPFD